MKNLILLLSNTLFLIGCSQPAKYDLVISNVGFFDGIEDHGVVNIGISADSIASISPDNLAGDSIMDGTGKYIIPGLINSHVHLWTVEQLKESFQSGILVNLAMHSGDEEGESKLKMIGRDSSEVSMLYGAGHAATVPGGHPNQISRNMETINDSVSIKSWVDNRIVNGADYIKIVKEDNPFLSYPGLPTLTDQQIGEIIDYSRSKGLMSVVHVSRTDHFRNLLKFNPDGFVHTPHFNPDSTFTDNDWRALKESGAFLSPNIKLQVLTFQQEGEFEQEWVEENMIGMKDFMAFIKHSHELEIPLLAGTDSPNNGLNYGSDFIDEVIYFTDAGLSNLEALKTATGNPSKAFNLDVGILRKGSQLNMLLLNGNPIEDLEALRDIELIWKNGTQ